MKNYLKKAEKLCVVKVGVHLPDNMGKSELPFGVKNNKGVKLTKRGLADILKSISKGGPSGAPCGIAQDGPCGEKMYLVKSRKIYGKQIVKAGRTIKTKKY